MQTTLTIKKQEVLDEIAKTTAYIGSKVAGGDGTEYDRISTTNEDAEMLERYWQECKGGLAAGLTGINVAGADEQDGAFSLTLDIPSGLWNGELHDTMERSLFSYFANGMLAKWQVVTNKQDVEAYATQSAASLLEVQRAVYKRKRPGRPA